MISPYIDLLARLVSTPSTSRDEDATARLLHSWLDDHGVATTRIANNIVARQPDFDPSRPTLMLNSHHDTVRPNPGYTRDPYMPTIEGDRLYGLGSNDAGASVVSLIAAFMQLKDDRLPINLMLAISAEEECSGINGMRRLVGEVGPVDMAIVGEPTQMRCAVGERGLLVLDCTSHGVSGHAARHEGVNALYKAVDDINRLRTLSFPRTSAMMGDVNINVTMIEAGTQHNVIPAQCRYVVDVRTTDAYTNEETVEIIRRSIDADVTPRSTHIRASAINDSHPLVKAIDALGIEKFLSPTTSDMALMPFPSIKIGPGHSARSHSADEYIGISEIQQAIDLYVKLIKTIRI
ncbi:MAG: M20/M25/M40 family metallo-hydrolase [Muribaculaceae bacterium]|nr:M20/M25/M40 family metallo-hydrolase [Muribaculaceae bacterium]